MSDAKTPSPPQMSMRDFLRGGYHTITVTTDITNRGRLVFRVIPAAELYERLRLEK